ncbi:sn-glycerol-3-phosphate ABC transporter substrate-binding protein UgpB [uncultured Tistrella sp.]|uniref:sn-glycerol-3-phosphate ABC transporter substrate-binding protein UgpB n=1 Tax=Tistrella mobilis TaxID=171437 RepID=UPI000C0BAFEA|nr:sn-glycerol-3-phosphate ABC transporter substrate-binding protein UgpB [uncultured Tistrella sp.]MAM72623.1 sn-glycerol-3-phosphate ABC transporter substrate-binding protein UgpB [Tistrella sp.]
MNKTWIVAAAVAAGFTVGGFAGAADAATKVEWWHAMGGELGQKVEQIAKDFNAGQSDYEIVPVYKGNYAETMTGAIAAFRAGQQPAIVQVFEVGTATMMAAKGAVKPVYQVMEEAGEPFDPKAYLQAVTGYYSTTDGRMLSMPFNSSTPVMYVNLDAAKKVGIDYKTDLATWEQVGDYIKKAQAAGSTCGLTTGWPSWTQLENVSAWHNQPFASKENGFGGFDTELTFNGPVQVKHLETLGEWQKTKAFDYGGRRSDARPKFISGECVLYIDSSASLAGIRNGVKDFTFGVTMLPYWKSAVEKPQNSIIGGASLWVLNGKSAEEYKGVAKFFSYLSSPEVQADWHLFTGYLPITTAAYDYAKKQGAYDKTPEAEVAIHQINLNPPTANSKGLRLGNFVQIRDVIEEEMEQVFAGKKTAKAALDDAKTRGDELLRRFERTAGN